MTIGEFFFTLVVAVAVCGVLFAAARPLGFLEPFRVWIILKVVTGKLNEKVANALILCDVCMATFWGILTFWACVWLLRIHLEWRLLLFCFFCWAANAVANRVLWTVLFTLEKIRDHYGNLGRDPVRHPAKGQRADPQ